MRHLMQGRIVTVAAGLAVALGLHLPAWADYPVRPVTVIVSDQAGGPGDIVARTLGKILGDSLKQPVLVENRPGAYGSLGLAAVARAKPDGYTLGVIFMPHTASQTLFKGTPYNLRKDFAPLAKVADLSNVLVVNKSVPAKTPTELAAYAKGRPGQMNFGSGSTGSPSHLSGELFKRQAGIDAAHVPFKGPVDAVTNLIGGRVDFMFLSMPVAMPMIKADKLTALAVTGTRSSSALPGVPTMSQAGFKDFVVLDWMGFVAPAGTPTAVVDRLAAELQKAVAAPEYRDRVAALGIEAGYGSPMELGGLIDREVSKWEQFIGQIGLSLE